MQWKITGMMQRGFFFHFLTIYLAAIWWEGLPGNTNFRSSVRQCALVWGSLVCRNGIEWIWYYGPMPACSVIWESHRLCKGEKEGNFVRAFQRVSRVVEYSDRLRYESNDFSTIVKFSHYIYCWGGDRQPGMRTEDSSFMAVWIEYL